MISSSETCEDVAPQILAGRVALARLTAMQLNSKLWDGAVKSPPDQATE